MRHIMHLLYKSHKEKSGCSYHTANMYLIILKKMQRSILTFSRFLLFFFVLLCFKMNKRTFWVNPPLHQQCFHLAIILWQTAGFEKLILPWLWAKMHYICFQNTLLIQKLQCLQIIYLPQQISSPIHFHMLMNF